MPITKGFRALVDQAMAEVKTYTVAEVLAKSTTENVQIVDIRDVRELKAGTVAGSYHAPRCMLEFWVDPESPYHKKIWADESKEFILFCGAGWRSALAAKTLQDMGMTNVAHIDGGYEAWINAGAHWPDNRVLDPYDRTNDIRAGRDWWSLQLFTKPSVPISATESENPIDAFVAERLNANGLAKSPRTGKRDQIRRLYFDLIGLPPGAENIEAFIADASSDAYEKIVDYFMV